MKTSTRRRITALGSVVALFLSFATLGTPAGAAPTEKSYTITAGTLSVNGVSLSFPPGFPATVTGTLDGDSFTGALEMPALALTFPDLIHKADGRVGIDAGTYALTGTFPDGSDDGLLNLAPLRISVVVSDGAGGEDTCAFRLPMTLGAEPNADGDLVLAQDGFSINVPDTCSANVRRSAGLPTDRALFSMTATPATAPVDPVAPVTPAFTG